MVQEDFQTQSPLETDGEQVREELVAELRQSQEAVARLLASMATVQDWQPEPAEWSFRYIAAHLAAVEETCHLDRVEKIATGDTPDIANYRDRGVDFSGEELLESLEKWQTLRRRLLSVVGKLSARELRFIGIHEKLGALSLLDALREIVDQDQGHLRHIRRLIVAYYEEHHQKPPQAILNAHLGGGYGAGAGQTENGVAPLYTNHKHGAM